MEYEFFFTVFTPTFNRVDTLARVFDSLQRQTFRNFEWLIIDDGSKDGTHDLVQKWKSGPLLDFPIRYYWQENGHKKIAHNSAVKKAKGEMFLVFDSDDRCIPEALEVFERIWSRIPNNQRVFFAGVCALCMYESGKIIGNKFPGNKWVDSDSLEMRYKYGVYGEKWGMMRTDILRKFLFPEDIPGLVPEGVVWDEIARYYKIRFVNEPLRVYCQDTRGLIARRGEVVDASLHAVGAAYSKMQILNNNLNFFQYNPAQFFLDAARLLRFWLHTKKEHKHLIKLWPNSVLGKLLFILASPLGVFMWLNDRRVLKLRT